MSPPLAPGGLSVDEWQTEQMVKLGLAYDDITLLLAEGYDWHDVERLLRQGCPPEMIVRILV